MTDDHYEPEGEIDVMDPGIWENDLSTSSIKDWFAVVDDGGIFAFVNDERLAWVLCNVARARAKARGVLKGNEHSEPRIEKYVKGEI